VPFCSLSPLANVAAHSDSNRHSNTQDHVKFKILTTVNCSSWCSVTQNLNGTHQLLFDYDNVNILCGSVHTIKKNTATLVVASMEN